MKKLSLYNEKRNFKKTTEPMGKKTISGKKLRFVVQHHLAKKEHYDFRLELNGVLISFAVPKGPSYNISDKRLAVHVEDHPLSYRNFEGIIPKSEYGGGTVMIFDYGYWIPLSNPNEGFEKGNLKFILKGKRLLGKWTLIHFKDNNWLLIKENDGVKGFCDIHELTTSIKTGRTMKEIEGKENFFNVSISNPDKIIYSRPKVTKENIVNYYYSVLKRIMHYLDKRLISTIRCPSGNDGTKFYKKHFESFNKNLGKKIIRNNSNKKEDYYYIKNGVGLIQEVQMNGYEFHIWGSKVNDLKRPDILVFDLDPDELLDLKKVRQGVRDLKSILDELHLVSFLKTSGGKGYHIVVPISSIKNFDEASEFTHNIAKIMEMKWPQRYTSNIRLNKRNGMIFIDWVRNTFGATSVCPYSLRIKKKLRVSMPIKWSELDKIKPDDITMDDALKRLKRKDPWENFFDIIQ